MFQQRKKVGGFVFSSNTLDSLHRRRRGNQQSEIASEESVAMRKHVTLQSVGVKSIHEMYKCALERCPSISINVRRQQGVPCIKGTRIPAHLVIWAVEQSGSIAGALKSYPDLTTQQVKDALYFAETILGSPNVITEAALTTG